MSAIAAGGSSAEERVVLTATFASDRIEEALEVCLDLLGRRAAVRSFPMVSDPAGLVITMPADVHVAVLRLEDWRATLEQSARAFLAAIRERPLASPARRVVCVAPSTRRALADEAFRRSSEETEALLAVELASLAGVHVVPSAEITSRYGTSDDEALLAAIVGAVLARALGASNAVHDGAKLLAAIVARSRSQRDRILFDVEFVAPRTALEKSIASMWEDLIGVDRVGLDDAFFDLGGDSLLATRIVSRLLETRGVAVPLAAVFEAPTIAQFAALVEGLSGSGPGDDTLDHGEI